MRLLAALFGLMVATAAATLWFSRRAPDPSGCETRDLSQSVSPDQQAQVDLFEVRCGDAITTHVALRAPLAPVYGRSDVFVALGAVPVRLSWSGPRQLTIESPRTRVLVAETRWRGITVQVR